MKLHQMWMLVHALLHHFNITLDSKNIVTKWKLKNMQRWEFNIRFWRVKTIALYSKSSVTIKAIFQYIENNTKTLLHDQWM